MDHYLVPILYSTSRITDFSSADGYPPPIPAEHLERRALAGLPGHAHPRRPRHRPRRHRPLLLISRTSPPDVGEWTKPERSSDTESTFLQQGHPDLKQYMGLEPC